MKKTNKSKDHTLKERIAKENKTKKDKLKKVVDQFASIIFYSLALFVVGCNIFIFSNVLFKSQNETTVLLLIGNFVIFAVFSYMCFKQFEDKNEN
jgi:hypothetical protein